MNRKDNVRWKKAGKQRSKSLSYDTSRGIIRQLHSNPGLQCLFDVRVFLALLCACVCVFWGVGWPYGLWSFSYCTHGHCSQTCCHCFFFCDRSALNPSRTITTRLNVCTHCAADKQEFSPRPKKRNYWGFVGTHCETTHKTASVHIHLDRPCLTSRWPTVIASEPTHQVISFALGFFNY